MSQRHKVQDATGVFCETDGLLQSFVFSTTTPTASANGYQVGCFWVNKSGTPGTIFYVNIGTTTSATWQNIA